MGERGTPNPGSEEAVAAGCTCPVIDNHYGRGARGVAGEFYFDLSCPVHREAWMEALAPFACLTPEPSPPPRSGASLPDGGG
jgi:hypothetical protein